VATDWRATPGPLPPLERVGVDMGQQRALSVREAIEMALTNNKDIEVARENVRAAEFDLSGAKGVYDPRIATNSYYEKTETPAASTLSGSTGGSVTQSGFFSTSSFQGLTPKAGGGYRVDFVSNRVSTDNLFASLNPQYPTSLTFNYTQPILRGRRFDANRRLIEIAKKNLSLTDAQFRQRAIETITNVQRAYWDLVFSLRNLQIQRDAVTDARAQLEHNRRLVRDGLLAPIDVVAAEAQISGFEQSVYSALDDVGRAENSLKNLIAENRDAPLWNVAVVPTDSVDLQTPTVDLQSALASALKARPEIQSSDVTGAINEIEQRFAREQTRSQVDLVASYGLVGLAGSLNPSAANNPLTASNALLRDRINQLSTLVGLPPLPPQAGGAISDVLIGGYSQSLTNLAANRFTNFRVGVNVNIPLRNRTAQAQLGRTLVDAERIHTQREQLEQLIQVDVRNSLQLVKTAESRLRSAASARSASEQQYASEQRRLDAGQSTVFLVLERQTALATARGNELRAQTELNKAIADLQRATGNALEENHVEVHVH
ncbi:MAG: TolC family protein, partial [Pyrinomonadaceae bacterium]